MKKLNYTYLFLCLTLISLFIFSSFDSENEKFKIVKERNSSKHSSIPTFVEFSSSEEIAPEELSTFFNQYWKSPYFGFRQIGIEKDQLGFKHYRYQQTFQDIPIEFAILISHTKDGKIKSLNGELVSIPPKLNEVSLTEEAALKAAKNHIGASVYKWQVPEEENHLKNESDDPAATYFPKAEKVIVADEISLDPKKLSLAYKFNIYAHEPLSRYEIYVDASNGKILFKNSLIHTANSKGSAVTGYSGTQDINTDSVNANQFRLRQTVNGSGINTYNMSNGIAYGSAVDFTDSNNVWDNVNLQLDQYATDAHWGAEQTYDFYKSNFNRNSINNNGFALNSYVHFSTNFANAFWDGQRMTYGDGNFSLDPFQALDVVGHEITHGLTNFSANLIFQGEQGALNESFSDIFGTAIEFHGRSNRANWTVGEDIGFTLRSMSNPNSFRDPDTYRGSNWKTTVGCTPTNQNDQCGVHSNSGVQNFWFYLLTNGGSGTNDNNDSYSVSKLGIDTAAAIAFRNLTVYLSRFSDFEDARFYSIQSAVDLYGPCSNPVASVTDAWHAVGIGAAYIPGVISDFNSVDTVSCESPFRVNFENESNNGLSFFWDFGDNQTDTVRNPVHIYTADGKYDVKLIADGGSCGADTITKTAFITIDSSKLCRVTMQQGTNSTQTDCSGKLLDAGGLGGNYPNNQNAVITIAPSGASSVTLTINSIDIEAGTNGICNFDKLEIFDGFSVNAPSLGVLCNGLNNPPTTITSTFGGVTLRFTSDANSVGAGFDIDWSCNFPSTVPTADFLQSAENSCTGEIEFQDFSTEAPTSWSWDFGDGGTSNSQNPIHDYVSNGTYDVELIVTNSFGSDTIKKINAVNVNRPASPLTTSDTVCIGEQANISGAGNGVLRWFDRQSGGNQIGSGTAININGLSKDSSVWVEDFTASLTQTVGPATNAIGSGANFTGNAHLVFDVFEEIELLSVRVFSTVSGTRTIELRDSNGVVLQSLSGNIPATPIRVNLNFVIQPGKNYQLGLSPSSQVDLFRNDGGTSYPYDLPGKLSIKESSASTNPTGFYYFFYNWRVKSADCISLRSEVKVKVDTTCTVVGLDDVQLAEDQLKIYPNPVKESLNLEFLSQAKIDRLQLFNISGKMVYERQGTLNRDGIHTIDVSNLSSGVYFLTVRNQNEYFTKKVIVHK